MPLKVESLFDKFSPLIKAHGSDLVKKVGHVYHFEVAPAKGVDSILLREAPTVWTIDLKNGAGSIKKAKEGTPDATFSLTDDDAVSLFNGTLKPQTAFMQGKMKIKGNMQAAMKFTPDLFPKDAKLWSHNINNIYSLLEQNRNLSGNRLKA